MNFLLQKKLVFACLLAACTLRAQAHEATLPTKIVCTLHFGEDLETFTINDLSPHQISGEWTRVEKIKSSLAAASFASAVASSKDLFLLHSSPIDLARACYAKFAEVHHPRALYFTQIEEVRAFKADDPKCNGHQIINKLDGDFFNVVYPLSSAVMKQHLKKYNFAVVLEGMVYRSKMLGRDGIDELSQELQRANQPAIKSIASIHVMGFGGLGGDYNLQEISEAKARGITFLHTYAYDKSLTVYMDGTDPSKIIETDPDHGNIYDLATVTRFIPDPTVRSALGVDRSIAEKRVVMGDTHDFLQSIINMIDAPWPLLIHCKGGRHKTGMFALILEYLAFNEAMALDLKTDVSVPLYRNRVARWFDKKGSFFDIFFGGPLYEHYQLHPAELRYFEHNKNVFREKNIDFVRGIVNGTYLENEALKAQWALIQEKFRRKMRMMAPFGIGQY
jgi:hypothetical protein